MKKAILVLLIFNFCLVFLQAESKAEQVNPEEIVLVCHKDVPLSTVSKAEVLEIFLGKTTSLGEKKVKIKLATLKDGPVHISFVRYYIKKTVSQFKNFWKKQVFSGKAKMPKSFNTEKELIEYVSQKEGAIGYVHIKTSNDKELISKEVKIISIKQK